MYVLKSFEDSSEIVIRAGNAKQARAAIRKLFTEKVRFSGPDRVYVGKSRWFYRHRQAKPCARIDSILDWFVC